MKKILFMFVLLSVLVLSTGCGGGSSSKKDSDKIVIGCTVYYMTEFITLMVKGVELGAKEQDVELIILDANNDVNRQISQIENLIAQKVDALLVAAVDKDGIVPAITMAEEAGIPFVAVNMEIDTDLPYYYYGPDDVQAGELEAQAAVDAIGGKGGVVVLQGPIGTSAEVNRTQGIKNVLAKNPDVELLAIQPGNWSRDEALNITERWLETFSGKINAVIAENDEMGLGAVQAIEAKGLQNQIVVVGVDAIEDACVYIKDGRMFATVLQDAEEEGKIGLEMAATLARGGSVNPPKQLLEMKLIKTAEAQELLDTIYK